MFQFRLGRYYKLYSFLIGLISNQTNSKKNLHSSYNRHKHRSAQVPKHAHKQCHRYLISGTKKSVIAIDGLNCKTKASKITKNNYNFKK